VGDTTNDTSQETTSEGTTSEGTTTEDTTSESEDTTSEDTTSDDTTSDDTTSADTTTTEDTDGPPGPMAGDPCNIGFSFYCMGGPTPEDAGTPLFCDGDLLLLESTDLFDVACERVCSGQGTMSVDACGGIGVAAKCLCLAPDAPDCQGAQLGCVGNELQLCHQGKVVVADCPNCGTSPEGWFVCE
jgi:hypothetical protein